MSKKIAKVVKIQLPGGEAKPGAALASAGIVMPKFCSEFNEKTADQKGKIVPVIIEVPANMTPTKNKEFFIISLVITLVEISKNSSKNDITIAKIKAKATVNMNVHLSFFSDFKCSISIFLFISYYGFIAKPP